MDKNEQDQTEATVKTHIAAKVDPAIAGAIEQLAADEERTVSNTIERLMKTHPRIQPLLEATA